MGHGGEVWQNVVHWRREWQTTSVFLPQEPHEQYEKAKNKQTKNWILKDELPRLVDAQYMTGDSGGINPERMKDRAKAKTTCSYECDWWWKQSPML